MEGTGTGQRVEAREAAGSPDQSVVPEPTLIPEWYLPGKAIAEIRQLPTLPYPVIVYTTVKRVSDRFVYLENKQVYSRLSLRRRMQLRGEDGTIYTKYYRLAAHDDPEVVEIADRVERERLVSGISEHLSSGTDDDIRTAVFLLTDYAKNRGITLSHGSRE